MLPSNMETPMKETASRGLNPNSVAAISLDTPEESRKPIVISARIGRTLRKPRETGKNSGSLESANAALGSRPLVVGASVRELRLSGSRLSELRRNFNIFTATVLRLVMTSAILLGTCPGDASIARTAPATTTLRDD